jgi:Putative metal-binding motif
MLGRGAIVWWAVAAAFFVGCGTDGGGSGGGAGGVAGAAGSSGAAGGGNAGTGVAGGTSGTGASGGTDSGGTGTGAVGGTGTSGVGGSTTSGGAAATGGTSAGMGGTSAASGEGGADQGGAPSGGSPEGGAPDVGGSVGVGGSVSVGGSAGTGGSDSVGGSVGSGGVGGSAGGGGNSGSGGAPPCEDGATRDCCHEGHQTCTAGVWGACEGAYISAESCNGIDDDCNGEIDELGTVTCGVGACTTTVSACGPNGVNVCVPGTPAPGPDGCDGIDNDCNGAIDEDCATCIHVAPDGDDTAALANDNMTPFLSVQAAIDFAQARPDIATRVCVAAGAACGATASFPGPASADLTMRDGVDVFANYESTTWTRCTTSTTHLAPQTSPGVLFPSNIAARTNLDGFTIDRSTSGTSTTGVTIDGAKNVVLSNLVLPAAAAPLAYEFGVTLADAADALIFASTIAGGNGSTESAAVESVGAKVALEDSKISVAVSCCPNDVLERVIVLEDSPGSRIERSSVSGTLAYQKGGARLDAIAIHGDATGVIVRENTISPQLELFGSGAAAISAIDCAGASPWIAANVIAPSASTMSNIDGIYAAGDCHPVIEANPTIVITAKDGDFPTSIHCAPLSGVDSACVISRNENIGNIFAGTIAGNISGVGVLCEGASCSRIDQNAISGISQTSQTLASAATGTGNGVTLNSSNALVERNSIIGVGAGYLMCNANGYGVLGGGTASRIQNNNIVGGMAGFGDYGTTCARTFCSTDYGVQGAAGEVYSNHIVASTDRRCVAESQCLNVLSVYGVVTGPGGDYRNNAIEGCAAVKEANANADPSVFENNALASGYLDEGGNYPVYASVGSGPDTRLSAAQVNALTDMTSSGNIDGACYATGSNTLAAGSPCIDAGTPSGAPALDYAGQPRDSMPDIGSDEYQH